MTVTRGPDSNNDNSAARTHPAVPGVPRAVWIGFALITGLLVGVAAGVLSAAGGVAVPLAVLAGGGACGSAILLVLAIVRYATEGWQSS
ncbi:uncharacterized protein involved in exopolysaccharide biosynthesis [Actinoplanes octamycinicus]|uniref:Uncharacterized protein involved in exopolysaccharide biosynthesis n=1 Tax=Actinoplanes octamycinicus TaxID=135948 RepID=A0A7W7H1N3_9ACTN|nr:hypothetical protein [Actinoplanes octamycinicus]MBB4742348.1 uncharacterized protein involved in exopolysaccharide biosynthesis [Actinoplanes octamycinicus]GIE62403.1 hypothetical protein Aoc01nite_78050 [Actinoplanes octamycinicus]